jgi:glyoxylase-like metal-dependent hydrolase (beta-lactamase superfamily II)
MLYYNITRNLEIRKIQFRMSVNGREMTVHSTLLWDEGDVVLVDTGVPGMMAAIESEMEQAAVDIPYPFAI